MGKLVYTALTSIILLSLFALHSPLEAAPLTPGNVLVIDPFFLGESLLEYQSDGTLVQTIPVQQPVYSGSAGGIVFDEQGLLWIYNGDLAPYLSSWNSDDDLWTHWTFQDWNSFLCFPCQGIGTIGDYVFVTDMDASDGPNGLIRFDRRDESHVRFAGGVNYSALAVGTDTLVYARRADEVSPPPPTIVDVFDPTTLDLITSVTLSERSLTIAADILGQIYGVSGQSILRYSSDGTVLDTQQVIDEGALYTISLSQDGRFTVVSSNGEVVITDADLIPQESFFILTGSQAYAAIIPQGLIEVTSPSTGTTLAAGENTVISWKGPTSAARYDLYYSSDEVNWQFIATVADLNTYDWTVPEPEDGQSSYKLAINAYDDSGDYLVQGFSGIFTINPGPPIPDSVSLGADKASPQPTGTSINFTAAASGGSGSYEYKFWVMDTSNGSWYMTRDYSASDSWTWNSLGVPPGAYQVAVHARNAGSTADYEAYDLMDFVLEAVPAASSVTLNSDLPSPQDTSTSITYTATASGGSGSYEYKFWIYDPSTSTWYPTREYSTTNTWTWDSTGVPSGSYLVAVHARSLGSTSDYEVYDLMDFVLEPLPPASSVTIGCDLASPQDSGTSITYTAAAGGSTGSYEYKFWVMDTRNGAWYMTQDYSASDSWTWNSVGVPPGSYQVAVHARSSGSTADYEVYNLMDYVLLALPAATGATISADLTSPQKAGTSVTYSASGSGGGGSYEYKFWVGDIGNGLWYMVQDYSADNTWVWETDAALRGLFRVVVHVRSSGSTADYEAFDQMDYVLTGPGDVGNYFPMSQGDWWNYSGVITESGSPPVYYNNSVSVTGLKSVMGVTTTVFTASNPDNYGGSQESYIYKDLNGITNYGNSDPTDTITPQIIPYQEMNFPATPGYSFVQTQKAGLDFGEDLDMDGINEKADVYSTVTVEGLESVIVSAGSFQDCARIFNQIIVTVTLSSNGARVTATGNQYSWYAPGVGLVKSSMIIQANGFIDTTEFELTSYNINSLPEAPQ